MCLLFAGLSSLLMFPQLIFHIYMLTKGFQIFRNIFYYCTVHRTYTHCLLLSAIIQKYVSTCCMKNKDSCTRDTYQGQLYAGTCIIVRTVIEFSHLWNTRLNTRIFTKRK